MGIITTFGSSCFMFLHHSRVQPEYMKKPQGPHEGDLRFIGQQDVSVHLSVIIELQRSLVDGYNIFPLQFLEVTEWAKQHGFVCHYVDLAVIDIVIC